MKVAFLFAGQGAQNVGMGADLYATNELSKKVFDEMKLDFDVKDICFNGPSEKINDTKYAQSCILTTSLAIAEAVSYLGIKPSYVAGLSLGEYSALSYAGAFNYKDAGEIVAKRGEIMALALPPKTSGMAAVIGMSATDINNVLNQVDGIVRIANYNCPGQIVITGEIDALNTAIKLLKDNGCRRIIPLNVSGAFHSPLLEDASKKLKQVLNDYDIKETNIPVIYNVSGHEENRDLKEILSEQIKSSVMFEQSIRYMIDKDVDTFIEIGPGKTLAGFVRKINKDVKVYSVNDSASLQVLKEELLGE